MGMTFGGANLKAQAETHLQDNDVPLDQPGAVSRTEPP